MQACNSEPSHISANWIPSPLFFHLSNSQPITFCHIDISQMREGTYCKRGHSDLSSTSPNTTEGSLEMQNIFFAVNWSSTVLQLVALLQSQFGTCTMQDGVDNKIFSLSGIFIFELKSFVLSTTHIVTLKSNTVIAENGSVFHLLEQNIDHWAAFCLKVLSIWS